MGARDKCNNERLGKRILASRRLRGLSQAEMGDRLGIAFQQVRKCEHDSNNISAAKLKRLADILGVPVASF
jgi:transcriptional regulator with XRE-family HTH domain